MDLVGYSRLVSADEEGTIARLRVLRREVIQPIVHRHDGRVIKSTGDGVLAEFASAVQAVRCAIDIQRDLSERESERVGDQRLALRIGINLGDVIIEADGDVYGDGVNIAARLEALCEPGGVCISRTVRDQVRDRLQYQFEDRGEHPVKNIPRAIRVFQLTCEHIANIEREVVAERSKSSGDLPLSPPLPDKPSIAVLPFTNMSGDPEQEYFADGIVEDLTTALSRLRWLFVIARNSSFTYKGRAIDVKRVGRELGVRYVLEGSVRKAGVRVRITVQLIETATGMHVWAQRYDRPLEEVFALQDEITDLISCSLEPEISTAERERARRTPPQDLGAWEFHQRGMWHLLRRNRHDFDAADELFSRAIDFDPNFAAPRAARGVLGFFRITHGIAADPAVTAAAIVATAKDALAIDAREPLAHTALGLGLMEQQDYAASRAEHEAAIRLNPNSAFARWAFGYALLRSSRTAEALNEFETALRLSPRDPAAWSYLTLRASALFQLGRFEEAAACAHEATNHPTAELHWPYDPG
jgi:adenylate cyclase